MTPEKRSRTMVTKIADEMPIFTARQKGVLFKFFSAHIHQAVEDALQDYEDEFTSDTCKCSCQLVDREEFYP